MEKLPRKRAARGKVGGKVIAELTAATQARTSASSTQHVVKHTHCQAMVGW